MNKISALWKPAWYELDQSLFVGERNSFNLVKSAEGIRFATGLDESSEQIEGEIISIKNSELGNIVKLDTRGLSYKFYTNDNAYIQIDAEEHPGLIEKGNTAMTNLIDTLFYVEFELV